MAFNSENVTFLKLQNIRISSRSARMNLSMKKTVAECYSGLKSALDITLVTIFLDTPLRIRVFASVTILIHNLFE